MLTKLDDKGNTLWSQELGKGTFRVQQLLTDSKGNVYLVGFARGGASLRRRQVAKLPGQPKERRRSAIQKVVLRHFQWTPKTSSAHDKLLAMNDAVDALAPTDPVKAEIVKLKYFVGLAKS